MAAAFAGNYWHLSPFPGGVLLFGSVAVLAAARLYGTIWGVLAAAIGGYYTVLLWGHPYGLAVQVGEALAVGLAIRHGYRNLVLTDGLFWLVLGMPALWAVHAFILDAGDGASVFIALRTGLNGLLNALLAGIVVQFLTLAGWLRQPRGKATVSLQQTLFNLLVSSALVPALLIAAMNARNQSTAIESMVAGQLDALSREVSGHLEVVGAQERGLSGLQSVEGLLAAHGRMGRMNLTLLDPERHVLATSRKDLARGMAYDRDEEGDSRLAGHFWLPESGAQTVGRWRQHYYVREVPVRGTFAGTLAAETPAEPFQKMLEDMFVRSMLLMWGLSLLASLMGWALSRWLSVPLARLADASTDLKAKLVGGLEIRLPASRIAEMDALIRNFGDMSQSLRQSYRELLRTNESLEQWVQERTRELSETNERLKIEIAERRQFEQALAEHTLDLAKTTAELESQKFALDQHSIVAIADQEGRIFYANDRFCEVSQYSRGELLGQNHRLMNSGYHPPAFFATLWETIGRGGVWHGEICNRRKDGSLYWVDTTIVPFMDVTGRPYQYVSIRTDVTERKLAEEELIRAKEAAEQASRAKSEFLSRMSHELRTPLNAIIGFAQLMENDPDERLGPSQKESTGHILRAGWHLLELINEVLDLSRIEAGKMQLAMESIDLASLVDECLGLISPLAAERGVKVAHETASPRLCPVHGDRIRLKQVVLNLMSNGVKYNREGGVVTLACQTLPDGMLRVSVADTGDGIPPDRLDQLFKPFSRLDADKTGIEGTGAGLAIIKRLVELMGGRVGVDSVMGRGSVFWVDLVPAGNDRLSELEVGHG
jgi:PAS domain S-box-containing protein